MPVDTTLPPVPYTTAVVDRSDNISGTWLRWLNDLVARSELGGSSAATIDASQIVSGLVALNRGGTAANLSTTGGAGQYVKQSSSGATFSVGPLFSADLTGTLPEEVFPAVLPAVSGRRLTQMGQWSVLSAGEPENPEIVFNSFGEAIMVFTPLVTP